MDSSQSLRGETRREMLKKAAYVAPVVLTLTASPAFARGASVRPASGLLRPGVPTKPNLPSTEQPTGQPLKPAIQPRPIERPIARLPARK
jgi:hypothetical protein